MSEPFIGQIQAFGFHFAPRDWAFCSGNLMQISDNQALFSLLGGTYGGDSRITFGLPNLTSRAPVGFNMGNPLGLTPYQIGQMGGSQQHLMHINEMPTHNHSADFTPSSEGSDCKVQVTREDGAQSEPSQGDYLAQPSELPGPDTREQIFKSDPSPASLVDLGGVSGGGGGGGTVTVANNGGNQAFDIRNPFTALNFCIALQGLYPQRN
ncbi:phage tail protein [Saccharospirillum salsuginis]|uniref:Microcystin dependent MdpB family protein n=1 Tax=Saccharospirillum salsuginis TaxID=418750 RepID=A0A918N7B2_9GAMM|nr:tail fiber protein [Saccharospirillum salsuginis]GGX49898.1 microcystin dependent MdpB family protein [Saccharospirillum salsuginis]